MNYTLEGTLFSKDDLEKAREILESYDLNIILKSSVEDRVLKAAELWLRQDLAVDKILVEHPFDIPGKGKGIIDLGLLAGNRAWIVDWKTTGSVKRPNFANEISNDFQSSIYLAHAGDYLEELWGARPEFLEYRCLDENHEVLSFRVPYRAEVHQDIDQQLDAAHASYSGLVQLPNNVPWPRNRPHACFRGSKGGPTCPFWRDCKDMTMPPTPDDVVFEDHLPRSKSSLKAFMECPEKFRRQRFFGNHDTNDNIKIGEAFHLLVAHLWQTSWNNLKGN